MHVSTELFGDKHPNSKNHEVNLCFQSTTFIIFPHMSAHDAQSSMLRGCDVIQIYHKVHTAAFYALAVMIECMTIIGAWGLHRC